MTSTSGNYRDEFLSSLDKLYKEGTYSDLTITCGHDEYKVHKAIVCPRSDFFATACNGLFEEGRTGIISLPDDDPQAVAMMIRFFYYFDYPTLSELQQEASSIPNHPNPKESKTPTKMVESPQRFNNRGQPMPKPEPEPELLTPNLTIHARVYALGEKYDIGGLKTLSLGKFKTEARVHWNTDGFISAVEEAYTSTIDQDRGMRDAVVEAIYQHISVLDKKPMQDVVRRLDLCFDLMMRFRPAVRGVDRAALQKILR